MEFFSWLREKENLYFFYHIVSIAILAFLVESFIPIWTTLSYPAIILFAAASFMWNYPVKAIKAHGLFSEWLVETRLLWLFVLGLIAEYLVLGVIEHNVHIGMVVAAIVLGVLVLSYSRSRLQEKLVKARGFK